MPTFFFENFLKAERVEITTSAFLKITDLTYQIIKLFFSNFDFCFFLAFYIFYYHFVLRVLVFIYLKIQFFGIILSFSVYFLYFEIL